MTPWVASTPAVAWFLEDFGKEARMYSSVHQAFVSFSRRFEGYVSWMYLDQLGLVTVGLGNLIDSVSAAQALRWVWRQDGKPATTAQVDDEWKRVKSLQGMRMKGGGAFAEVTFLEATPESVDALIEAKLTEAERVIRVHMPAYDSWPADAQLAALSMAWAVGPDFALKFPRFTAAANAGDWRTAADECRIATPVNPSLTARNKANATMFRNAAEVLESGLPIAELYYPRDLSEDTQPGTIPTMPPPENVVQMPTSLLNISGGSDPDDPEAA